MAFPSTLSTFNRPNPTDRLNNPSHSALHNTVSSAVGQIEAVIGVEGTNSVVGTLEYLIKSPASNGGGHVQTAAFGGTGQTTFTKGDMLIAQSASILTKLAVGVNNQVLTADSSQSLGVKWGVGAVPTVRVYNAGVSIWNKPSLLAYAIIEVQGNGANGGDGLNASPDRAGGGGGGGGYSKKTVLAASLPLVASVFVRSGGGSSLLSYFASVVQATGGTIGGVGTSSGGFK
jgi:hypothetical protein